ncbi:hypothetical protein CANCADRAFT_30685 [Tortispora caseinolytica NRRL Y-17796]|uniref:Pyruvate decarboxylase n=1 Tax=Tortispora caseinolytica NRRL Y-17796 TaxID=767744 RepID=A0A1E4TLE4_9ASCO|nr:hypothetical protein CANCADRAFT_30685 [Tortispora caseinolytica NRRL Y-17796]
MRWVGNTNELNAGYAADGYARTHGIAALITTFGVGELSALAAVGGSYAEHVGVVHIVGVPAKTSADAHAVLHHTLGNGDFDVFAHMSRDISADQAILSSINSAPAEIDRLLRTCWVRAQPVYLGFPTNLVEAQVPASLLDTPLDLSLAPNDPEVEDYVVNEILQLINNATSPAILVDACTSRHRVVEEVVSLAKLTQIPVYVTPMGKSSFDEQNPLFAGVYVGELSNPKVKERAEKTDLVISVGAILSDFNTGSFSYHIDRVKFIELHSNYVKIKLASFPGVQMKPVFAKLLPKLSQRPLRDGPLCPVVAPPFIDINGPILHEYLWPRLGGFLRPGDHVVTETGTSSFGINQTRFASDVHAVTQVLWGSIGYSVGACLGVALAAAENSPKDRVILFVGDGSLQLTVTEISTMIRHKLKPILFILNNDGYTIERLIHGPEAVYNDIQMWKYTSILDTFNAEKSRTYKISTAGELDALLKDEQFNSADVIQLVELVIPKLDAPSTLKKQAELTAQYNAGKKSSS